MDCAEISVALENNKIIVPSGVFCVMQDTVHNERRRIVGVSEVPLLIKHVNQDMITMVMPTILNRTRIRPQALSNFLTPTNSKRLWSHWSWHSC